MKRHTLLNKILRIIAITTFVITGNTFAIGPILGGLAGVPVLGGIVGTKAGSAKALLSQAADVIIYLKLFLFILFVFSFGFFALWICSFLCRKLKQSRLNKIVRLLELVQSRMISMKNGEISSGKGASREDLIKELCELMKKPSFKKLINYHLEARFVRALVIVRENKIDIKDQISLIDRWQQVFMLQI
jgi:hypothetical protein